MEDYEKLQLLLKRYLKGESSQEELDQTISFINNPLYDSMIRSVLNELWNNETIDFKNNKSYSNGDKILLSLHRYIDEDLAGQKKKKAKNIILWTSRFAAVLVFGIVIGFLANRLKSNETALCSTFAPKGSISQMVLPDSTIVYLNSDSELKYSPDSYTRKREVRLNGEAWFEVKKNTKNPFLLHTDYYDVKVTGTRFNVKAYKDEHEIVTTLEQGSVTIPSTKTFKLSSDKILKPGEQLVFDRDSRLVSVKNVETKYYTAWKDNKLIFINMSLDKLVILLERRYGVDIEVKDKSLLSYHYDGTFKNESILEIMELLKVTLPIDYQIVDQKIEIFNEHL